MRNSTRKLALSFVGVLLLTTIVRAELATLYFTDGKTVTVEFIGADRARLIWKENASAREERVTMRSELDKVLFPTTEAWRKAEEARESGRITEALKYYEEVLADPAGNYFPFPGNFASLSKERILQCFRQQLDAEKIAKQAKVVREEFFHLPPELKRVEPETAAWTAIANKNWQQALEAIEEAESPGPEALYLKGRALEALGENEKAISAYAGTYVLNFGGSTLFTRDALKRSSKLVSEIGDPDRIAQLQAQVKLYRDLYGNGSLWKGASETLASLADAEIKPLGDAENEMEKPSEPESDGGLVVSESAAVATLPPAEERDFLLAEELEERVYVIGRKKETMKLEGGVTKEGENFRFDGTGGHIQLEPIELSTLFLRIRLSIVPDEANAVLANVIPEDKGGGFSLYLKEGNLTMDWAAKGADVQTDTLAPIELNKLNQIEIIFRTTGDRETLVGRTRLSSSVPEGGLGLKQSGILKVGDSESLFSGEELPPFKGLLHHFSLETDRNSTVAGGKVQKRFGKNVFLLPPLPAE